MGLLSPLASSFSRRIEFWVLFAKLAIPPTRHKATSNRNWMLLPVILGKIVTNHMLERDRDRRALEQLQKVHIAGELPPSVTLLDDLPKFLNETKTAYGRRIVNILEQMIEIESMTRPLQGIVWPAVELKRTDPKKFQQLWEVSKKTAFLERELAKYRFRPRAEVMVGGEGGASQWVTMWTAVSRKGWEKHLRMPATQALELILKLTEMGRLTRLRRCGNCGRWLYARIRHQNFCSLKCQQKNYAKSPEWKVHRRAYMRKRYRELFSKPRRKYR